MLKATGLKSLIFKSSIFVFAIYLFFALLQATTDIFIFSRDKMSAYADTIALAIFVLRIATVILLAFLVRKQNIDIIKMIDFKAFMIIAFMFVVGIILFMTGFSENMGFQIFSMFETHDYENRTKLYIFMITVLEGFLRRYFITSIMLFFTILFFKAPQKISTESVKN